MLTEALAEMEVAQAHVVEIEDTGDTRPWESAAEPSGDTLVQLNKFIEKYEQLQIVNPTKAKFETTLMDHTHYDLLRLFSNELERESSVLFVLGFSCGDAHISELVKRAALSNPTLQVLVFPHKPDEVAEIAEKIQAKANRNENIRVIAPFPKSDNWPGYWTLDEFSVRVIDAIVPRLPSEGFGPASIEELAETPDAGDE